MEMKLSDGDYIPDGLGGFVKVSGAQEILNRVLFKLTARRGGFAPMPEIGSRLYMLGREKPSNRSGAAKMYVIEALADEKDISVADVQLSDVSDGRIKVTAMIDYLGQTLEGTVLV